MKKLLSLIVFLVIFFTSNTPTFADEKFSTSYDVSYNVGKDENTKVVLNVSLKNKTSDFFAGAYSVQSGFSDIESINASDAKGPLSYKTQKNDTGTLISFNFNDKVVGINNIQKFTISFETKEIAKNDGNIWEVNIPGVSNQSDYEKFNASVTTPYEFGSPAFIKPSIGDLKSINNTLNFTKNDLGSSGISISYGKNQIYEFDLTYHLYNKNLFPINTEIAIPSNNNYQEIRIDDINPKPKDVTIDKDGNWIAKYHLIPSQKLNINVKGVAKVSLFPYPTIISDEQKKLYTSPQKYWEIDEPAIKKLATQLKTPENIHKYVVDNLKYDASRVTEKQIRAGAMGVLQDKKSAVCLEFTDLFIALARSAGIPARQVEGYANTSNSAERPVSLVKDVLHTWPEYYDSNKKTWIMVDPTWENTTKGMDYFKVMDFDHLAFVIKGENSEYPVPAGGYKFIGDEYSKDVIINATSQFEEEKPSLKITTKLSDKYIAGLPIDGEIVITNASGVIVPNQTIKVTSESLSPNVQDIYFDKIPPFGKKVIKIKFDKKPFLTNDTSTFKITINNKTIEDQIVTYPIFKSIYFYIFLGVIFGTIIIVLSIIAYKSRHLHVS